MTDRCPKCHHPLPAPSARDFERMPTRDREAMLERAMVRKGAAQMQHVPIARVVAIDGGIRLEPRVANVRPESSQPGPR